MRKLVFLFILVFLLSMSIFSQLKAEDKISLTLLDFSDTVKKDVQLRSSVITTLRRYNFIKYIPIIKADTLKNKESFKTDTNYIQNSINIGSQLKVDYIITIYKEVTTNFITNTVTNYFQTNDVVENISTNDIETLTDNGLDTVDTFNLDNTNNNESLNENNEDTKEEVKEQTKEEIKETYKMYAVNIETGNIIKNKDTQNKSDINNFTRDTMETLGVYYANNLFKKISEKENNLINIDFFVNAYSYITEKTRKIENGGSLYFGDTITFNFNSSEEGYIYIIVFQSDGNVILMYPNDFIKNDKIKVNTLYTVPEEKAVYQISVAPQNGIDNYYILYTKNNLKITNLTSYMSGVGFKILNKGSIVDFVNFVDKKLKWAKKDSYKLINYNTTYSEYFDETFFNEVKELEN